MTTSLSIRTKLGALCALGLALSSTTALACRIIIPPEPWPHPHPRPMPAPVMQPMEVKSHRATMTIDGQVAKITVEAVFHNPNPSRIEGTYLFPIARQAAVSSFAMTVNGKTMEAELLEAGKAREIYESIVRNMRDPALLEYVDDGLLRARVFPIEPRQDVKVQLTYDQVITRDGSLFRVAYPLLSTRPGGDGIVKNLVVDVTIRNKTPIKTVFVPGFEVDVTRPNATTARLTFEATDYKPSRDFEVIFGLSEQRVGIEFLSYRKGDNGYFMMLVAPDSELQAEEVAAKAITFVVDTSGSMMGDKINQAREALLFCVNSLNPDDTFNIVSFATDVVPFAPDLVPATEDKRAAARTFIQGLKPRGGTAIDDALAFVLSRPPPKDRVPMVAFLTDGIPTIGEVDPATIVKRLDKHEGNQRIFAFGVGYDVNTRLLDGISAGTRGISTYVRPGENLELALSSFYEKIAYPVMTDLKLDSGKVRLTDINPRDLPDLFKGSQLMMTGRFDAKGTHKLTLSGAIGDDRETFLVQADLDGDPQNAFIARMWAISRVGYLQEQIRLNGRTDELVDEIKRLGREYGILTPYTSFLIVEEGIEQGRLGEARRSLQHLGDRIDADSSGMVAVESARMNQAMKMGRGAASAPGAAPVYDNAYRAAGVTIRKLDELKRDVHDKTFYFRRTDGFWYDSVIPKGESPKPAIEVVAYSPEFFKLLDRFPVLRKYLLVGEKLLIDIDGVIIRITAE